MRHSLDKLLRRFTSRKLMVWLTSCGLLVPSLYDKKRLSMVVKLEVIILYVIHKIFTIQPAWSNLIMQNANLYPARHLTKTWYIHAEAG